MPGIFFVRTISFWQALGLLVLSKILFGSFRPHIPDMAALASAHDGTLGTDDTGRARQCTRQFVQLLLAREGMVAGTNICRCVFVHHSDVIFPCNLKKHGSLLFSGTASRCPDHIHHSAANGTQVPSSAPKHEEMALKSLPVGLDFGGAHQPTIWHVPPPQSRFHYRCQARLQGRTASSRLTCKRNWHAPFPSTRTGRH